MLVYHSLAGTDLWGSIVLDPPPSVRLRLIKRPRASCEQSFPARQAARRLSAGRIRDHASKCIRILGFRGQHPLALVIPFHDLAQRLLDDPSCTSPQTSGW